VTLEEIRIIVLDLDVVSQLLFLGEGFFANAAFE